jgi:predicted dehydrogenase
VAVVGCGAFARLYHVPALTGDARVRLTVICEPAPDAGARELAARTGARLTTSLDEAWGAAEAVVISTPHTLHAEHARAALAHGRHVLLDKPFVLRSTEARELAGLAAAQGRVAAVAFNRRFDPACRRARELVAAGALGSLGLVETVQFGYATTGWVDDPALGGGGPFVGRGAHMADLVPWLTGFRPRRVRARTHPGPPGRVDRGGLVDVAGDGPDWQAVCLTAGGPWMWDEVRVFGDAGTLELRRPLGQPLGWALTRLGARGEVVETLPADPAIGRATRDFLDAVDGRGTPACPFGDAWLSVRIIEAAFESAARDGAWIDVQREAPP